MSINYEAIESLMETFEYQLEMHVAFFADESIDATEYRAWAVAQTWPTFDANSKTCQLACAAWWESGLIVSGNSTMVDRESFLRGMISEIQEPPKSEFQSPILSPRMMSSTYRRFMAECIEHRREHEAQS